VYRLISVGVLYIAFKNVSVREVDSLVGKVFPWLNMLTAVVVERNMIPSEIGCVIVPLVMKRTVSLSSGKNWYQHGGHVQRQPNNHGFLRCRMSTSFLLGVAAILMTSGRMSRDGECLFALIVFVALPRYVFLVHSRNRESK